MTNYYSTQPELESLETTLDARRATAAGIQLSPRDTIIRPEGGGQPADIAWVRSNGPPIRVNDIIKADGRTWLVLKDAKADQFELGESIVLQIDLKRRLRLSRCHTLTHILMAAARRSLSDFASKGADIAEDGRSCTIRFFADSIDAEDAEEICKRTRDFILEDHEVCVEKARSVDHAAERYEAWRVEPDLNLRGKVRVIRIGTDIDANPCSGTHVGSTGQVGGFELVSWTEGHSGEAHSLTVRLISD